MKASIVDLRYKTKEILQALERNESVTILYHGKGKGMITPAGRGPAPDMREHALFGLRREASETVQQEMERLRKPRHDV
jgi:antitoxin (DNA-binding transcriptional repressor) of toxin-antitoxin stability system